MFSEENNCWVTNEISCSDAAFGAVWDVYVLKSSTNPWSVLQQGQQLFIAMDLLESTVGAL